MIVKIFNSRSDQPHDKECVQKYKTRAHNSILILLTITVIRTVDSLGIQLNLLAVIEYMNPDNQNLDIYCLTIIRFIL
jgi:hypothetical protein